VLVHEGYALRRPGTELAVLNRCWSAETELACCRASLTLLVIGRRSAAVGTRGDQGSLTGLDICEVADLQAGRSRAKFPSFRRGRRGSDRALDPGRRCRSELSRIPPALDDCGDRRQWLAIDPAGMPTGLVFTAAKSRCLSANAVQPYVPDRWDDRAGRADGRLNCYLMGLPVVACAKRLVPSGAGSVTLSLITGTASTWQSLVC
jgi:hypothetical protein